MSEFYCDYCSDDNTGHSIQYSICRGRPFCHDCGTKMTWIDIDERFACECDESSEDEEEGTTS